MKITVILNPNSKIIKNHNCQPHGPVQKFIDLECIRRMNPYTPMLNGVLVKSVTIGTKIGSGEINQNTPYARYQYYGKLMISSLTGSSYATHGEKKVLTDRDLLHNASRHPQSGPYWFERMKADHKDKILEGAQKVADRG